MLSINYQSNQKPYLFFLVSFLFVKVEIPLLISVPGVENSGDQDGEGNEIIALLRMMLAQALNQQDRNQVAQLYETIRSVSNLDQVLNQF